MMKSIAQAARAKAGELLERAGRRQEELRSRLEAPAPVESVEPIRAVEAKASAKAAGGVWALYRLTGGADSVSREVNERLAARVAAD